MPFFEETRAGVLVSRLTTDVQTLTTFTRTRAGRGRRLGAALRRDDRDPDLALAAALARDARVGAAARLVVAALRQALAAGVPRAARPRRRHDVVAAGRPDRRARRAVVRPMEQERYATYRVRSRAQVSAWRRISLVNIGFFPVIAFAQSLALAAVLVAGGYLERHGRVTVGTIVAFALYLHLAVRPDRAPRRLVQRVPVGSRRAGEDRGAARDAGDGRRRQRRRCPPKATLRRRGRDVRATGDERAGGRRRLADDRARRAPRARRRDRRRQVDARQAARARVRPGRGRASRFGGVDLRDASLDDAAPRASSSSRRRAISSRGRSPTTCGSRSPARRTTRCATRSRAIGALERFEALPDGLATDVRSRGVRLSSGERQLVSIARVALVDPAVIVLDEATSSLDPQTEAAVEHALSALARGRTVITIAHRLSTAERADRVAVMEHGRLVEFASHDELVRAGRPLRAPVGELAGRARGVTRWLRYCAGPVPSVTVATPDVAEAVAVGDAAASRRASSSGRAP